MKILVILLLSVFLLANISASCEEGQIDINTASAEELDEIVYVGEARAEQIKSLRPFESVDDLIRVNGIGPVYLDAIKSQNLACVADAKEEMASEENKVVEDAESEKSEELIEQPKTPEPKLETIILNPKVIKTEDNKEVSEENSNYAAYGLAAFFVLIAALFLLRKNRYKNEFE